VQRRRAGAHLRRICSRCRWMSRQGRWCAASNWIPTWTVITAHECRVITRFQLFHCYLYVLANLLHGDQVKGIHDQVFQLPSGASSKSHAQPARGVWRWAHIYRERLRDFKMVWTCSEGRRLGGNHVTFSHVFDYRTGRFFSQWPADELWFSLVVSYSFLDGHGVLA
jgi:hypothetical protein